MSSYKKLHILEQANEGIRLALKGPSGDLTEDWITVRGIDSDVFQHANKNMRRKLLGYLEEKGLSAKDSPEYVDMMIQQTRELQASLVVAWSFDEPCTNENILELFTNAPYIAEQVDLHASKRELFVKS